MKTLQQSLRRWLLQGLLALSASTVAWSAQAANNWEIGKQLHQNNGCTDCHARKDGRTADQVTDAIANVPAMNYLGSALPNPPNLTADNISDIAAYLSNTSFPTASFSRSSISYANTAVGDTSVTNVTVSNDGDQDLNLSASLSDTTNYLVSLGTCGTVAAGDSCVFSVTFRPQSAAAFNSRTLTLDHNAFGDPDTVSLSGTGIAAVVSSASSLSPSATVGSPTTASAVITNNRTTAVAISTITFGGSFASDYSVNGTSTCNDGTSIPAGGNCTLVIRFNPASASPALRSASANVAHNANGSPLAITLNGNATAAPQGAIATSASSIAFADTQLAASTTSSITVSNSGTAALQLSSFALGGSHPGDFERAGTCSPSGSLAIGATCTIDVTFRPSALGARAASLTIAHDGSNPSAVISLSGNGVPVPAPLVALAPASLNFGAQTVGGLYPARTVQLTNSGTATLNVASITIDSAAFSNVSATACPATLAPAQSCNIDLRFAPPAAASYSGTLRVISNTAGSPHTVALAGNGSAEAAPALSWSPAVTQLDFGNVTVGSVSAVQSATLRNAGPGGAAISLVNAVGIDAAMFAVGSDASDGSACRAGRVLFEGETCRVDVRFAPGANGARSAVVQVASNGAPPPQFTVQGSGLGGAASAMSLSVSSLALDATRVGARSAPQDITIRSSGGGTLRVLSMSVGGPFALASKTCPAAPFTLTAGTECVVSLSFVPTATGAASGTLDVATDASTTPASVTLSAQGQPKPDTTSGGGCSIAEGHSAADPTLWLLVLLAMAALASRRRLRQDEPNARDEAR
jgi:trimeric autotransporter adhesin